MRVTRFRFPGAPRARALLLAAVLLPGCRGEAGELSPGGYAGVELTQPRPKPDFTLTTTDGGPFDFRRETDGYLTFLFFGYTNCPDVCPVHMANLAAALDRLPRETARDVRVVFVTTDPARDTPARIREWLDAFDPGFIGLTGTPEELSDAQVAAGLLPAMADTAAGAAYEVGQRCRQIAAIDVRFSRRLLHPDIDERPGAVGQPRQQHLIRHHPKAEDVGARVDGVAAQLFGRHVGRRADDGAAHREGAAVGGLRRRGDLRDAEVEHLGTGAALG